MTPNPNDRASSHVRQADCGHGAFHTIFRVRSFETFFEHGQWWCRYMPSTRHTRDFEDTFSDYRTFSAIDAIGGRAVNGVDFEEP